MFISSPIPHNNFPSCLVNINIISYLLRRKANSGLPVPINESRYYPFCTAGQYGKKAKCDWLCSPSNANIISQILAWFLQKIQRKKKNLSEGLFSSFIAHLWNYPVFSKNTGFTLQSLNLFTLQMLRRGSRMYLLAWGLLQKLFFLVQVSQRANWSMRNQNLCALATILT